MPYSHFKPKQSELHYYNSDCFNLKYNEFSLVELKANRKFALKPKLLWLIILKSIAFL